jgi:hypothetical protein
MVVLESPTETQDVQRNSSGLGTRVVLELKEIVKGDDLNSDLNTARAAKWVYRMPFPGVRYYAYED